MADDFKELLTAGATDLRGDAPFNEDHLFQPEPAKPGAEFESPASPDRCGLARARVKIEPVEEWVTARPIDFTAPAETGGWDALLVDEQVQTARRACYSRRTFRLATFDAVQQAAKWQLLFDPATQSISLHYIRLHRGAETLEQANLAKMQFLQREQGLSASESIDGEITLLLILEDVRLGDILDVAFTQTTTPRFLGDRYSAIWWIALPFATREHRVSVRFPAVTEMRWKSSPTELPPAIRTIGEDTEWSWQWRDVAVAKTEPNTPWWHSEDGWVQVSSFSSWEEIVAGIRAAWERSFDEEELNLAARRIAESAASAVESVEKALALAQDDIRYLSVNLDLGGQIPADPSTTLRRRYGDCKDKSYLLAQLLRRLGYPARPVLVHTKLDRMLEKFLPSPSVFDHAVVEFEYEGRRRWIDATMAMQGGGVLARAVPEMRWGLPLGPGVTGPESLPGKAGAEGMRYYGLCETFRLGTAGQPVRLRVMLTLRGADADDQRRKFHHHGARGVSLEREQWYGALFPGARRTRALEWRDDREKNELVMAEAFELPQAMRPIPAEGRILFEHRPYLIRRALSTPARSEPRRSPLALGALRRIEHTIEMEWAALPRSEGRRVRERNSYFQLRLEENRAIGRWSSRYEFELLSGTVGPADLPRFEKHVGTVADVLHVVIFGPNGIPANTKPWTGSLLPIARRAPGSDSASGQAGMPAPQGGNVARRAPGLGSASGDQTAGAGAVAGGPLAAGVSIPDRPAEALLSAPAGERPPATRLAHSAADNLATVKRARPIIPENRSDALAEPRRRRRRHRKPLPPKANVALVFLGIFIGIAVFFALLCYLIQM